ncbi:MAG: hypothetical protein Kow0089_07420 [Desulfobulbaceae bacterium]
MNVTSNRKPGMPTTGCTSSSAQLIFPCLAAYATALAVVGIMYLLGLFDVGFLSDQSLAVQLAAHLVWS